jgi:16S rRNA (adenine1518-N6/adenine1519-N6)-dimethyltransferase
MNLRPKKSLGQHFLNSSHVLKQIIDAAKIKKDQTVLEIGPGTGFLTTALLQTGAHVVAVEKDDRACEFLKEKFSKEIIDERLRLIHGDILDPKILELKPSIPRTQDQAIQSPSSSILPDIFTIVANIPYYITGAILERFLEHEPRPDRMVLLVQREVAERIVATPDGKESILSISVKAFGRPRIIAPVPRGAFTPPPTVDSAILSIEKISADHFQGKNGHEEKNAIVIRKFFDLVRAGFAHKRKFLKRNLETVSSKEYLTDIWKRLDLDEKVRAEDISTEDWLRISEQI